MEKFTVEIRPDKWEENEMRIYRFGKAGPCLCLDMTTEQLRALRDSVDSYLGLVKPAATVKEEK